MNNLGVRLLLILVVALQSTWGRAASIELTSGPGQTTMVELFTSQGCSSCPPAEKWLNSHSNSPELWHKVIPLAFHVDYWDWIGWADEFAAKQHTQRQYRYKQQGHITSVYTPGFAKENKAKSFLTTTVPG